MLRPTIYRPTREMLGLGYRSQTLERPARQPAERSEREAAGRISEPDPGSGINSEVHEVEQSADGALQLAPVC